MDECNQNEPVNFGFEKVSPKTKTEKVQNVFDQSAENYDLMNDIMSLGLHTHWKKKAVEYTRLYAGDLALDLACGSCDITEYLLDSQPKAHVVASDPNPHMMTKGRDRLLDLGIHQSVSFVRNYAERLPFIDAAFNLVICAFGFRNFTDPQTGLKEMYRVLKPGGQIVILEFSQPKAGVISQLYRGYASIIPEIGQWVSQRKDSYRYLIESIEKQTPPNIVEQQLQSAGFTAIRTTQMLSGLVCIFRGIRC